MLYYANPCSDEVRQAMRNGLLGFIDTPAQGNRREPNVDWIADNGCYSNRWNADHWWKWLTRQPQTMRFCTAPDVVGDWQATLDLFATWSPAMSARRLPIACVAQDGATNETMPWHAISAVFIGGSTEWKLSKDSEAIVAEANRRSTWAHIGRVNTLRRLQWAKQIGANSVDGTMLTFNPTARLRQLLRWMQQIETQPSLDGLTQRNGVV